jgi:uncharacterized membrane protein YhfC
VERVFAVMFHVGVSALAGYGYGSGRTWRYLLLAIGLHSLTNYTVILLQPGLIGLLAVEALGALMAISTIAAALWFKARLRRAATKPSALP